jgi:hypothetical protein
MPTEEFLQHRNGQRHPCAGVVDVLQDGKRTGWGKVTDISLSGCYIETVHPFHPGTEVILRLNIAEFELQVGARVVWTTPQVGMGTAFLIESADERIKIAEINDEIAATYAMPAVQSATDPQVGGAAIHITKDEAPEILPRIIQHINEKGSITRQELIDLIKSMQ